jgi:hypothetical protein
MALREMVPVAASHYFVQYFLRIIDIHLCIMWLLTFARPHVFYLLVYGIADLLFGDFPKKIRNFREKNVFIINVYRVAGVVYDYGL